MSIVGRISNKLVAPLLLIMCTMITNAEAGEIEVKNECFFPVRVAVRYLDSSDDTWKTKYWYKFDAYEESYLANKDGRLKTKNDLMYFYAESEEYNVVWQGDEAVISDRTYEVGRRNLRFRKTEDWGYDLDLDLSCSKILEPMEEKCERQCGRDCMRYTRTYRFDSSGKSSSFSGYSLNRVCVSLLSQCKNSCMSDTMAKWKASQVR